MRADRQRRPLWALVALGLLALASVLGARTSAADAAAVTGRIVRVGHFDSPVFAAVPPDTNNTLYVVEQDGQIVVWQNGAVRSKPFLDIQAKVKSGGEQGLLSMAFDPSYARNHFFYVDYTDLNGDTRIVRYRSDGTAAIPGSATQLLFVKDFAANHNGGQLQFGPDGLLYWGNGDGGGAGDPQHNGQSLARPFAKIERLNVRVRGAHWKLVAYGLRNPWRFSFDRKTGDLYIGDVGQGEWEEIDYLPRSTTRLSNFGWSYYEGDHVYNGSEHLIGPGTYVPPIYAYSHDNGCAVDGGYVYRGSKLPDDAGRYYFGDNCSGDVWSLKVIDGKATSIRREPFNIPGLSSFAQDNKGELYLMSVTSGNLYRLEP
jgi:glucose/arabinose dehydrogenase